MYHSVDRSRSPISLDTRTFEQHADWFAESGVQVVSLEELITLPNDTDAVALTFDDAFRNFGSTAWPILQERGLPATVFVVSDKVGDTNAWGGVRDPRIPVLPLLDWDELGELAAEGVTIGAHSRTHRHLRGLSTSQLADEMGGSRDHIHERTGVLPQTFAYPFGTWDKTAAKAAADFFHIACTTELRPLSASDSAYLLPRLDAYYFQRPGMLEQWGTPRFRRYVGARSVARGVKTVARAFLSRLSGD